MSTKFWLDNLKERDHLVPNRGWDDHIKERGLDRA